MITQLRPALWLQTPKGVGLAHFVIDYGEEHDLIWVVADDATGEIWAWPNPKVRFIKNVSLDAERVAGQAAGGHDPGRTDPRPSGTGRKLYGHRSRFPWFWRA